MGKKILNLIVILLIGGLGGVLADNILLPRLAAVPFFSNIGFIRNASNGTTIINPTEKVIITESVALEEAIEKISPSLVFVQGFSGNQLVSYGTGFIATSDGLIITALDNTSPRADSYRVFRNNHSVSAQRIKTDQKNNLALLKVEEGNLPVVSLLEPDKLHLGERVILVGAKVISQQISRFVNLGIIRSVSQDGLETNITEGDVLSNGGPLINVKAEVIGLNLVNQKGEVKIVSSQVIKEFLGL